MNARTLLITAGLVGALGILIGAFGAHSLPSLLEDLSEAEIQQRAEWLETGSRYHMYHAAALLAIGIAAQASARHYLIPAVAWLVGILVFSGCLYAMAITGVRVLGAIVPLGGLAFVVGWIAVAWVARGPS